MTFAPAWLTLAQSEDFFLNSYSDDVAAVLGEGDYVVDVLLHFVFLLSASPCCIAVTLTVRGQAN